MRKFGDAVHVYAVHEKGAVKAFLDGNDVDLLIVERSRAHSEGLEITRYARETHPNLTIIWITVLGCNEFRNQSSRLDIFECIEKPLEIGEFRQRVIHALTAA